MSIQTYIFQFCGACISPVLTAKSLAASLHHIKFQTEWITMLAATKWELQKNLYLLCLNRMLLLVSPYIPLLPGQFYRLVFGIPGAIPIVWLFNKDHLVREQFVSNLNYVFRNNARTERRTNFSNYCFRCCSWFGV